MDGHRRLVVVGGGVDLLLLGRDRGVLLDQHVHHLAQGLDAERERRDVEEQHVLHIPRQHGGLDGGAHRDGFVGVDVATRFRAEEGVDLLLHQRHAGLAADQDHLVDVAHGEAGVGERDTARAHGAFHQILHQRCDLGAGELDDQVLRTRAVGRDVRQVHFRLGARGEFDLGLLGGFLEALQGDRIGVEVDAVLLFELLRQVLDDLQVEVLAAEERVAVGGQHLELMLAVHLGDLDDRDVEGAAAQVEDGDLGVAAPLVHAVGQRGRSRLVDDAPDVEARDPAGVLGRLALGVVEVGGHRDDGFRDVLAEILLRGALHLLQHLCGDLRRGELLAVALHPGIAVLGLDDLVRHHRQVALHHVVVVLAADQPLDREQGVRRVGHRLTLGALADEHLAVGEGNDGRRRAVALGVLDDARFAPVPDRHARVRRAEVDADDSAHD